LVDELCSRGALAVAALDPYAILRGVPTRKGRDSMHFRCVTPADSLPSAIVGTTRDIIQLLHGNNVNWVTVLKLDRVKGFKANWDIASVNRRWRQIIGRYLLVIEHCGDGNDFARIVQWTPWSSYIAAR
jgi:hypothetical protein